ncbi:hypothetical protein MRX96_057298 [Rhipicephalus microplus]
MTTLAPFSRTPSQTESSSAAEAYWEKCSGSLDFFGQPFWQKEATPLIAGAYVVDSQALLKYHFIQLASQIGGIPGSPKILHSSCLPNVRSVVIYPFIVKSLRTSINFANFLTFHKPYQSKYNR